MLHAYVRIFDVMGTVGKNFGTKRGLRIITLLGYLCLLHSSLYACSSVPLFPVRIQRGDAYDHSLNIE